MRRFGPARRGRPDDPDGDAASAGGVRPRRAAPFAGRHRPTPPAGGGHAAGERRTGRAAAPAHDRQLDVHLLTPVLSGAV